jgi:hypothetical protein
MGIIHALGPKRGVPGRGSHRHGFVLAGVSFGQSTREDWMRSQSTAGELGSGPAAYDIEPGLRITLPNHPGLSFTGEYRRRRRRWVVGIEPSHRILEESFSGNDHHWRNLPLNHLHRYMTTIVVMASRLTTSTVMTPLL